MHSIIGQGAYSKVYQGIDVTKGQKVAIKIIDKKLFIDPVIF